MAVDDYFEANMQILHAKNRNLADRMKELAHDDSLEVFKAESGDYTVIRHMEGGAYRLIHSRVNPKLEAETWLNCQNIEKECLVILGTGLAYHISELLKRRNNKQSVYLVEADEFLFGLALRVSDLSKIIACMGVHFLIGQDLRSIKDVFSHALMNPFSYHIFLPVTSLHPKFYEAMSQALEERVYEMRLKGLPKHCCGRNLSLAKGVEQLLDEMRSQ